MGSVSGMVYTLITENMIGLTDGTEMPPGTKEGERLRRILILLLAIALLATLAVAAGCGSDEKTIESGERKITVEEQEGEEGSGKITVEGEEGEATIEVEEEVPTEESLGVPIYPGADYVPDSGVSSKTTSGEKEFTVIGAEFTTADAMDEVIAFYSKNLGDPASSTPEETNWMFQDETGQLTTIIVEMYEGKVKITVARVGGDTDIQL